MTMSVRSTIASVVQICGLTILSAWSPLASGHSSTGRQQSVLLVLSSVDQVPGAPNATGNYLQEVAYPAMALVEAGYSVAFVTPTGRPPLVRGNEAYGLAPDAKGNPVLEKFIDEQLRDGRLTSALSPNAAAGQKHVAIFYTGSLGALLDLAADTGIAALARRVHDEGGFIAASGHGCAGLLPIRTAEGRPLISKRRIACFTRSEDLAFFRRRLEWTAIPPYHVESKARDAGAELVLGPDFSANVVQDGRILTGQNAGSVRKLTDELIRALRR